MFWILEPARGTPELLELCFAALVALGIDNTRWTYTRVKIDPKRAMISLFFTARMITAQRWIMSVLNHLNQKMTNNLFPLLKQRALVVYKSYQVFKRLFLEDDLHNTTQEKLSPPPPPPRKDLLRNV